MFDIDGIKLGIPAGGCQIMHMVWDGCCCCWVHGVGVGGDHVHWRNGSMWLVSHQS